MSILDQPSTPSGLAARRDQAPGLRAHLARGRGAPRLAGLAVWPDWLNAVLISKKAFVSAVLNGLTLAGLYFLVASGFTLVFGLMRNVNLAHGSLYLLGAYVGYEVATYTGLWLIGVAAGFVVLALVGLVMQVVVFRRLEGTTAPDAGDHRHLDRGRRPDARRLDGHDLPDRLPAWLDGAVTLPVITAVRSTGSRCS